MSNPGLLRWDGAGEQALAVEIFDGSTSGARLRMAELPRGGAIRMPQRGDEVTLRPQFEHATHLERDVRAVVRGVFNQNDGVVLGLQYLADQPMEVREAVAQLVFGSSENWLSRRAAARKGKGLIAGLAYVAWLALSSIPRTFVDFMHEPARRRRAAQVSNQSPRLAHLVAFGADFDTAEHRAEPDRINKLDELIATESRP